MKLHSLQISNVLSFAHHDNILDAPIVKFEEGLNILIGQNGAGKSTVLEVINFVFKRVVLAQFQRNQDLYERRSSVAQQEVRQVITRRTDQQAVTYGGFLPSSPFLGALAYIRERRVGLSVYLDDPEVSIDTNHLERALRVIPMGKKNWLFSWTELSSQEKFTVNSVPKPFIKDRISSSSAAPFMATKRRQKYLACFQTISMRLSSGL